MDTARKLRTVQKNTANRPDFEGRVMLRQTSRAPGKALFQQHMESA